jgi:predicted RNA-binding protein YlxR (DUF448 family)
MLRVVRNDDRVTLDPGQNLPGRGAYVHHDAACMEAAVKKGGLARTLRCKVDRGLLAVAAAKASQDSKIPKESKDS